MIMVILFVLILMSLVFIMSSHCWLMTWMGLEMMTFFFIPLLSFGNLCNYYMKVSSWKYFVYQSVGSSIFLICIQYSGYIMNISCYNLVSMVFSLLLLFSLLMKMGLPPFHYWLLEICENLDLFKLVILNSFQKFSSLFVLWMFMDHMFKMIVFVLLIITVLSVFCLFSLSFRYVLVFSSVFNSLWMIFSLINKSSALEYMMFYVILMYFMGAYLYMYNIKDFSCLSVSFTGNLMGQLLLLFIFISLCGFPPFVGFFLKFDVMLELVHHYVLLPSFVLLFFTIIFSIFYLYPMLFSCMLRKSVIIKCYKLDSYMIVLAIMFSLLSFLYYFM